MTRKGKLYGYPSRRARHKHAQARRFFKGVIRARGGSRYRGTSGF